MVVLEMKMNTNSLVISIVCIACFLVVAFSLNTVFLEKVDQLALTWAESIRAEPITALMHGFAFLGATKTVFVLTVAVLIILLVARASHKELAFTAVTMAATGLVNLFVKEWVERERPAQYMLVELSSYSFPSGHSMGAMSFYTVLTFLIWKRVNKQSHRVAFVVFASLMILIMGFSRLYLGVHYLSDVIGGYLLSGSLVFFLFWLFQPRKSNG
ncbi:hypothetical protein BC8716_13465 [Shouchella clausii]|nr:hypothetical protein BC8716_13465 [Shouchella clausii]PAD91594.1 hypothetical protein CHH52_13265 [Shouchella clausii]PTL24725.1 PAP2 family protein [Shouchella clausii]QNM43261.1 PAP2 family protein [Shouchella clausii]